MLSALLLSVVPLSADSDKPKNINLPDIGDSTGQLISPVQEQQLGRAFMRSVRHQIALNQDPEISDYIQAIGARLVSASDNPAYPFHFFVVMNSAINAFAGPGGYIGIHSGLILATESESELASVIAHEIAHVTQRHLYQAFEDAKRLSLPTAAAMLAALLIGSQSTELGQAALAAIQAGSVQHQINFTRDNEQEADRVGMKTLARSHYDPHSMPLFFEKLQQSSRYYGKGPPEFLRTHPVTSSRIADTRNRAEKYPYQQFSDSHDYQLIKVKLSVASEKSNLDSIKLFRSRLNRGTAEQKAIAQYGLALSLHNNGDYQQAIALLKKLATTYPQRSQFISALAEAELENGPQQEALSTYRHAIQQFPLIPSLRLFYGKALLKTGSFREAQKQLLALYYTNRSTPELCMLIARSYGLNHEKAQSHRYLAEAYYLNGRLTDAIKQLKMAQKAASNNFYLLTQIDERLRRFIEENKIDRNSK